mmetsp:Transcript_71717/g.226596  ORF Transcript_71717/g.226596 Transcript_71717/m.226596 type:complete len:259 (-) Transcript_71717:290-1066(-)
MRIGVAKDSDQLALGPEHAPVPLEQGEGIAVVQRVRGPVASTGPVVVDRIPLPRLPESLGFIKMHDVAILLVVLEAITGGVTVDYGAHGRAPSLVGLKKPYLLTGRLVRARARHAHAPLEDFLDAADEGEGVGNVRPLLLGNGLHLHHLGEVGLRRGAQHRLRPQQKLRALNRDRLWIGLGLLGLLRRGRRCRPCLRPGQPRQAALAMPPPDTSFAQPLPIDVPGGPRPAFAPQTTLSASALGNALVLPCTNPTRSRP